VIIYFNNKLILNTSNNFEIKKDSFRDDSFVKNQAYTATNTARLPPFNINNNININNNNNNNSNINTNNIHKPYQNKIANEETKFGMYVPPKATDKKIDDLVNQYMSTLSNNKNHSNNYKTNSNNTNVNNNVSKTQYNPTNPSYNFNKNEIRSERDLQNERREENLKNSKTSSNFQLSKQTSYRNNVMDTSSSFEKKNIYIKEKVLDERLYTLGNIICIILYR